MDNTVMLWIIAGFAVLIVATVVVWNVVEKNRMLNDLEEAEEDVSRLQIKVDDSLKSYKQLLDDYSSFMDRHEEKLKELMINNKTLELELEKKDMEIEKLKSVITANEARSLMKEDAINLQEETENGRQSE